ncbi:hypothetical protein F2Q69_00057031 [Brassica cretica]|uniref:GH16 domain-containing protein n=1 Tax=Brassica cretica TaxID=69181 RepID=A0A8S9N5J0_BRACR|nr:hypothetical protein F2Q69_00057031 [Brassica cretica]
MRDLIYRLKVMVLMMVIVSWRCVLGLENINPIFFDEGLSHLFGESNLILSPDDRSVRLLLDKYTCNFLVFLWSGFISSSMYQHGIFSSLIKLPGANTAGLVVAFYISNGDVFVKNHDELDIEFLGNVEGKPWRFKTNMYGNGSISRGREERYRLWFDPSKEFHRYSILWNPTKIIFWVDDVPIREIKRNEEMKGDYPQKPMSLYATIWDASSWATSGGKFGVDYTFSPFVSEFKDIALDGCNVSESLTTVTRDNYNNINCSASDQLLMTSDYSTISPKQGAAMRRFRERYIWDCSFQYGSLVEEVDGHTAVLYHRLLLDWFPMVVWPRDLCYVRYWRRNDDGSYVVLFRSREHDNCGPQPGCVRAHLESGGYNISPLKPRNGRPRTQVQHLIQIDLKGWGAGYLPAFQQHCLLQMLNSVAGLREWFSQTDERGVHTRIPVMVNMASSSLSLSKSERSLHQSAFSVDQTNAANRNSVLMDEDSDDDDEFQIAESEKEGETSKIETDVKKTEEEPAHKIDLSCFSGNLKRNENENARNCWRTSDGNNFKVRSKNFCDDKRKIPAGKHLMDLVAVDWFKDSKRIDHVARRKGCAAQVAAEKGLFSMVVNVQVPGSTHYSMVFYFVTKELVPGSLLQRFVDGDDEFRNSRLKLIPLVPKGSWIVRQSVGSTPCLLGKAVDCNYIRGPTYLEIDVDIGSSTVANGVLGLVIGVITSLVVEMAFLVQANAPEELPERLIGAVRVSHIELSSAIVPNLESG